MDIDPVEHFLDGRRALKEIPQKVKKGITRVLVALTLSIIGGAILLTDKPLILTAKLPNIEVNIIYLILLGFVLTASHFWLFRLRQERSLDIRFRNHQIAHQLRDHYFSLCDSGSETRIIEVSEKMATEIGMYFQKLLRGKDIKISIRIAQRPEGDDIEYSAVAKYGDYNPNWNDTDQHIPDKTGEIKLLEEKNGKGILIYHDMDKAQKKQLFFVTDNYVEHEEDVNNMIVAPINGWSGNKKSLIGLLYICSKDFGIFSGKHTDAALFVADSLATLYTSIIHENGDLAFANE